MNNQITYADKVALNQNSSVPDINKVNASDMNEIKAKHNGVMNGSIPMGDIRVENINSKNLFNQELLLLSTQWSLSNGYYTGSSNGIYNLFNETIPFYNNYEENTQYTFSCIGYVSASNMNFRVTIYYTDNTNERTAFFGTSASQISITSATNKTIQKITFDYSSSGTVYIKDIQFEKGTTLTSYSKYQANSFRNGSNTNGSYTLFDNGTLITSQRYEWSGAVNTAWGSLYQSVQITLPNFPIPFKEIPSVTTATDGAGKAWLSNNGSTSSKTQPGAVILTRPTTLSTATFYVNIIAIGKWK